MPLLHANKTKFETWPIEQVITWLFQLQFEYVNRASFSFKWFEKYNSFEFKVWSSQNWRAYLQRELIKKNAWVAERSTNMQCLLYVWFVCWYLCACVSTQVRLPLFKVKLHNFHIFSDDQSIGLNMIEIRREILRFYSVDQGLWLE